jgi:sugar-specific transcriptional regulator TrmB
VWGLINNNEFIKGIASLGLTRSEAEIYIYLAKHGPQKARNIAEALKMNKQLLYRYLRGLRSKEIVKGSFERPAYFSAVALVRSLEKLIDMHLETFKAIEKEKDDILNQWNSLILEL